jgi:cellulose synthase operon protein C
VTRARHHRDIPGIHSAAPASRVVTVVGAAVLLALGTPLVAVAAAAPAPTLKDLKKRDVEIRTDRKVDTNAAKAMDSYRRFLELQNSDPAQRAQALRRLGDLSLESGELERMESEVSRVDLGGAEAIRLYTTLLKAYPDYSRNDQVLYQLARAYETTGQPELALATLDEVIARYPRTPVADEVQFRRGELLFSAQRYREAERAYATVTDYGPRGAFYQQGLYKRGWSLFKQSQDDESLPVFAQLLDLKLARPGATPPRLEDLPRADRELVDDTLRVMSVIFSNQDGIAPLENFVTRVGNPPHAFLLYSRLGDLYVEKQRYQDAAAVYRAYVARAPDSEFSPDLSTQAIEAYRKGGFAQLVLEGKQEYVERYNFDTPFWRGRDRARYGRVVTDLKTNLTDVAAYYHATAQKSRRAADFSEAARWYGVQLASFPDDPDSARTTYLLADALFEGGRFGESVDAYEKAAYGFPVGENSAKAAYAALSGYQKQEPLLPPGERAAWKRRGIDSGIRFATTFPDHPDAIGVLTRATQDLYAAGDLPAAIAAAEKVLAHQPAADPNRRRIAHGVIGQSRFDQKDYAAAEASWLRARELAGSDVELRKSLDEQLAVSVYRQAEGRRASGDAAGAVEDFLRIAQVSPASPIRATAQYDAAAALIGLRDWPRAIDVLEDYRRENPKSEFAGDVTQKLAVAYSNAGRPVQAATEFERIADDRTQTPAVREEALVLAAAQREKAATARARSPCSSGWSPSTRAPSPSASRTARRSPASPPRPVTATASATGNARS